MEKGTCLVFGCDSTTVTDIVASLKLIEMQVVVAQTVEDAKLKLIEEKPKLIFARCDLITNDNLVFELSKNIKLHNELSKIPLIFLREKEEPEYQVTKIFDAELPLPVEFPVFTQEVRRLLEHFAKNQPRQMTVDELTEVSSELLVQRSQVSRPDKKESKKVELDSNDDYLVSNEVNTLDKRMIVAYGVQMHVLDKIRADSRFQNASLVDIPHIIAEITQDISKNLDVKELIGTS